MVWTPGDLFLNSETGVWLDISDLSTMFTDYAGTVPVTERGQPVRRILDKSGNGNDFFCPDNAPSPPVYQNDGIRHWLDFNGVASYLRSANPILGNSAHTIAAGIKLNTGVSVQMDIVEFAGSTGEEGGRVIYYQDQLWYQTGSTVSPTRVAAIAPVSQDPTTAIAQFDGTGMAIQVNEGAKYTNTNSTYNPPTEFSYLGVQKLLNSTSTSEMETITNYSTPFYGRIYQVVALASSTLDPTQESELRTYLGYMSGAFGDLPTNGQTAKVSGIVQINGTPAKRSVRAFGYNPTVHDLNGETVNLSKSLGQASSDPVTGEYTIDLLQGYDKRIFVVAFDDYGDDFTPDKAVAVGDRIHPTTPNGYVFEATGSGTLPSSEPVWVLNTDTATLYGTASMIAKPFYRPMVHGPVLPEVNVVAPWSPLDLFSNGASGAWLDPSDISTLFQDVAGTVPVTAAGQAVALVKDKSGNGNDAYQPNASRRPIYREDPNRQWLEFNGVDDYLYYDDTQSIGSFFICAAQRETTRRKAVTYDLGASVTNRLLAHAPYDSGSYYFDVKSSQTGRITGTWPLTVNSDAVISHYRGSDNVVFAQINGSEVGTVYTTDVVTSQGGRIGADASGQYFLSGRVYGIIVSLSDRSSDLAKTESYLSAKAGLTL